MNKIDRSTGELPSAGPHSLTDGFQGLSQFGFKNGKRQVDEFFSGNYHNIHCRIAFTFVETEYFPDSPLRLIANHRVAYFFRSDDSQARVVQVIFQEQHRADIFHPPLTTTRHHLFKLRPLQQAFDLLKPPGFHWTQTANRLRPLRRRLASTLRPPTVALRARNPWVRFLRTLLG